MEATNPRISPVGIKDEMQKSFISYAMAVIVSRALPDVRDGLKPVHRRILYSMNELGVTPDKPFRKCARVVGDVLGKYHPHGDSSVYDALVRLAQDFSIRNLLVEGQGNFGSVDGDGAAAMRYTEARLARISLELLADIDKDTVDFKPNFDETTKEPVVLPARFPNLLVNGSNGIAVGMATNIPPHNLGEAIDAAVAMIDDPEIDIAGLMEHLPGPDFPTGGIIMGMSGIQQAYRTGRGRIVVRARTEIEPMDNGKNRIVVTEIPYQVNKARLIEKIAELVQEKRVEGIADLRDESDKEGMRIAIELKRDVNPSVVLNTLYKHTQLQDTFGVIMLALVDEGRQPKVLNLHEMFTHYLDHQKVVVTRRTQFELDRARQRAHILEGLLIALDNIDEVIRIIRGSATAALAREGLMTRFGLSEKQAQAILDMRLQRLTGMERDALLNEYQEVMATIERLVGILADEHKVMAIVREELLAIKEKYADPRRTEIQPVDDEIDLEDLIQEEEMVVTRTHMGYIKRVPAATYRAQRRGGKGISALSTRDEDFVESVIATSTHSAIMFFTNLGRAYRIKCYQIPEAGRAARGTAIVNILPLAGGEKVNAVIPLPAEEEGKYLVMATRRGVIKKTALADFVNIRKTGIIAVNLREDDELVGVALTDGEQQLLIGSAQGKAIRFHEDDIRAMGRAATGVRSIDLAGDDAVVDMSIVSPGDYILALTEQGYGKLTREEEFRLQSRGGKGIRAMHLTEKTGALVCQKVVDLEEDIMLITADGTIIRMAVGEISILGRDTQGVRLMRVGDSAVVCVERVAKQPEDEEEADPNDLDGDFAAPAEPEEPEI